MTQAPSANTGFDRFGLLDPLRRAVSSAGFTNPRPIQDETVPAAMEGRDVLGLAQTGTGKTAAFALPILQRLLEHPGHGPRVLVLAPTRELATQITAEFRALSRFTRLQTVTIFGGVSTRQQIRDLRDRPEIVVGCPGRVLDLLTQRALRLDGIETLVLDEADHMFDMGFMRDIRKILKALPKRRQNLLFSATMPKEIRILADEVLRRPHVAELTNQAPASTIDHALYAVDEKAKKAMLAAVLAQGDCHSAIVFTRTKRRAKQLAEQLARSGHRAVGLQGNMSQNARDRAMGGFRSRRFDVLVATDIVARGIDVSGVSHVINFDVPNTPEAYTHRIGRTGRAELEGSAYTFVTPDDAGWVRDVERMIGASIPRRTVAGFDPRTAPALKPAVSAIRRAKVTGVTPGENGPAGHRRRRPRRDDRGRTRRRAA
ncbi:DEAD/DEAH box helicase [bacterium]|nr:DEAD/DEAH box helicase [bacterium]